jgi:uncharacterized protein
MNYNVAQLLKEPIGARRSFVIDDEFADPEHLVEYVEGSGQIVRTHQGVWVTAQVSASITQDCSRCLIAFNRKLELELDEEYLPQIEVKTGRRTHLLEDWTGLYIGDDHTLNLTEAIRQSAIATLPLKPLCRAKCGGICDRCGVDRNQTDCDCYSNDIDPRWAALRSLIVD